MIDKLSLTVNVDVDTKYLNHAGIVKTDERRAKHYKNFCELDYAQVMWEPHKYSKETNARFSYAKIDINPKYFKDFNALFEYLKMIFGKHVDLDLFHVTRIDIKSDIENVPVNVLFSRLFASGFSITSLVYIKGSIYVGSNPKIRVYDKTKEIKYRLRRKKGGYLITEEERQIAETDRQVTRFEIALQDFNGTLKDLVDDPVSLVSHFDRLRIFDFKDDKGMAEKGGSQILMSKVNRKFRAELDSYRDKAMEELIKNNYIARVTEWFGGAKSSDYINEVPF